MDRQGRGLCDEPPTPGWGPISAWLLWLFLSAFAIFFAKFYVFPKIKLNIFNQEMDAMNVNSPYGLLNFLLGAREVCSWSLNLKLSGFCMVVIFADIFPLMQGRYMQCFGTGAAGVADIISA